MLRDPDDVLRCGNQRGRSIIANGAGGRASCRRSRRAQMNARTERQQ